ncbi:MAG: transposase [Chloroflexales bacterium]|nr:transposase [Chloroflexales bacterium]
MLEQQLEACRWVYNDTLATRKNAWEQEQRSVDWYETKRALPLLKELRSSLKLVHSQVLQNVTERVDLAFKAFFRRVKAGEEEVGSPRFKGLGRYDSMTYPQYGNGVCLAGDRRILSKVGSVHVVLHRPVEGTPKTVTLTRSCTGKWYACFSCEGEPQALPPTGEVVGVDSGLASFATLSNGEEVANPRFYRRDAADLKRVQPRKDAAKNAQDWTENTKQKGILAKIHERIANRRADFAHQRSRALINRYQLIVFEDLAPQEMERSHGMRTSIMDVAWSQFIRMTVAKAEEAVAPRHAARYRPFRGL